MGCPEVLVKLELRHACAREGWSKPQCRACNCATRAEFGYSYASRNEAKIDHRTDVSAGASRALRFGSRFDRSGTGRPIAINKPPGRRFEGKLVTPSQLLPGSLALIDRSFANRSLASPSTATLALERMPSCRWVRVAAHVHVCLASRASVAVAAKSKGSLQLCPAELVVRARRCMGHVHTRTFCNFHWWCRTT